MYIYMEIKYAQGSKYIYERNNRQETSTYTEEEKKKTHTHTHVKPLTSMKLNRQKKKKYPFVCVARDLGVNGATKRFTGERGNEKG